MKLPTLSGDFDVFYFDNRGLWMIPKLRFEFKNKHHTQKYHWCIVTHNTTSTPNSKNWAKNCKKLE